MGIEPFENAAGAGAQILRVERVGDQGGEGHSRSFVLTFDVGSIVVRADTTRGVLAAEVVANADELSGERVPAGEEEPWWRVLGNPLTRAHETQPGASIRLQFRADGDAPRVIAMSMDGTLVRARVES